MGRKFLASGEKKKNGEKRLKGGEDE